MFPNLRSVTEVDFLLHRLTLSLLGLELQDVPGLRVGVATHLGAADGSALHPDSDVGRLARVDRTHPVT